MSLDAEVNIEDLVFDEDDEYDGQPVGSPEVATEAMYVYDGHLTDLENGSLHQWHLLGEGSYRAALLHVPTNTVYKLPREMGQVGDANPAEKEFWRMMRMHPQYAGFVPPHHLYGVVEGGTSPLTVMAVPYMGVYGGRVVVPTEMVDAAAHVGCFDVCGRNARFHRGRWYLIDASGNEWTHDPTAFGPGPGDGCEECNPEHKPDGQRVVTGGLWS